MNLKILFFLIVFAISGNFCDDYEDICQFQYCDPRRIIEKPIIISESEKFALKLLKIIQVNSMGNFMISPYSVWSMLILLNEGAGGQTKQQLEQTLSLPTGRQLYEEFLKVQRLLTTKTNKVELLSSLAMFANTDSHINPIYANNLQSIFRADILSVNFNNKSEAKKKINTYVSKSTNNLVNNFIDAKMIENSKLILLSTMFFKGQWKSSFKVKDTKPEPFYDENNNIIGNVEMMNQKGPFTYTLIKEIDSIALELPYGDDDHVAMIILLPKVGSKVSTVVDKLTTFGVEAICREFKKSNEDDEDDPELVPISIPKFEIKTKFVLNDVLMNLGIRDIFDASRANLTKISNDNIYLSQMFQQATIKVDEEGTLAAAVTASLVSNKIGSSKFVVNRPFVYLIVDKSSNSLLFCGQITNPTL